MNRCPQSGKQCHPTAASAWRVIQLRTSKLALFHHKQRMPPGGFAYRCVHCHQWHITSQQKTDWPRRRLARMEPAIREREART